MAIGHILFQHESNTFPSELTIELCQRSFPLYYSPPLPAAERWYGIVRQSGANVEHFPSKIITVGISYKTALFPHRENKWKQTCKSDGWNSLHSATKTLDKHTFRFDPHNKWKYTGKWDGWSSLNSAIKYLNKRTLRFYPHNKLK